MGASGLGGEWLHQGLSKFNWRVKLTILGDDGSVGNDDDGPLELAFKVLDNISANFSERLEGSERNSDQDVLGSGAVGEGVLDFFGRGEHKLLDVNVVAASLLVGDEALGNDFLQLGVLFTL